MAGMKLYLKPAALTRSPLRSASSFPLSYLTSFSLVSVIAFSLFSAFFISLISGFIPTAVGVKVFNGCLVAPSLEVLDLRGHCLRLDEGFLALPRLSRAEVQRWTQQ